MAQESAGASRTVANNRRARFDYFIDETIEAGIVLLGSEVKSLREGRASIGESHATEQGGEFFLLNMHIPEYGPARHFGHEAKRPRKLLMHRREIERLRGAVQRQGVTVVPLSIFFNSRGIAKVSLGLARGKRKVDKRADIKERDWQRDKARLLRERG